MNTPQVSHVDSTDGIQLQTQLYIDGRWCGAAGGAQLAIINPSTEEVLAHVDAGGADDVDRAVRAAARAFKSWRNTNGSTRAHYLRAIARGVEARSERLA